MREHIERVLHPDRVPTRKETLLFDEWFNGRFWSEHVLARKNKPGEMREKKVIYECHLKPRFGAMRLDEITTPEVARFRAALIAREEPRVKPQEGKEATKKLSEKRINNILAVLSKAMKYAVDCELIAKAPKIGMFKVERPEIVAWDFEQYARLLTAAKAEGDDWYAAVCLAGEAGLRVGEIKALRWREDVDMIARTITVHRQTARGETGTPKGRTRRTVPMTVTLHEALKRMSVIREGFVIRDLDGTAKTDTQAVRAIERICRKAGLPVRLWHTLRHSFGTHAALFGVNPWRLQVWLGHKRIDETMIYVHVAEAHGREWPAALHEAAASEVDPDKRILAMLGARGKAVAKTAALRDQSAAILVA